MESNCRITREIKIEKRIISNNSNIMTQLYMHIDDLEFIDEYPNVKVPLRLFEDSIIDTTELITELKNK